MGGGGLKQAPVDVGLLFVLALWCLSALGFRARASVGLAVRASVWGFVVLGFGMAQSQIWVGPLHVYVRVMHLLVGLLALGLAETLAGRIKRSHHAA